MGNLENLLVYLRSRVSITNVVEIIIIAFFIYKILVWIKGTQAENVVKGIIILFLAAPITSWLGFTTLNYLFSNVFTWAFILLIIVFQPEMRGFLDKIGGQAMFKPFIKRRDHFAAERSIELILEAVDRLSEDKIGALIVLEDKTGLKDIAETGIIMNAEISTELLENIFTKNRPLHDGAVIINLDDNKIIAASCLLPLSNDRSLSTDLGTRHRAALGISEKSDAFTIIVSEETGMISCTSRGEVRRNLDINALEKMIEMYFFIDSEMKNDEKSFSDGVEKNDEKVFVKALTEQNNGKSETEE